MTLYQKNNDCDYHVVVRIPWQVEDFFWVRKFDSYVEAVMFDEKWRVIAGMYEALPSESQIAFAEHFAESDFYEAAPGDMYLQVD